jgi:hypothetical protein
VHKNGIGGTQRCQAFPRDRTKHTHRQTGTGERMSPDPLFRQTQCKTSGAHFIFEQVTQRLDQGQLHIGWQPADVVMSFDRHALLTIRRLALDDIGIERSLRQKARAFDAPRLALEDAHEFFADDLPFLLRVGDIGKSVEELIRRIDCDQRNMKMLAECGDNLFGFTLAQQPIIDNTQSGDHNRW